MSPHRLLDDLWELRSMQPSPPHGVLPTSAHVLTGASTVLVDTGLAGDRDELLAGLWSLVEADELATVFLTHEDADHAGNLLQVLDAAPRARLVTSFVTVGRLLEATSLPLDRVDVVNPGDPVPGTGGRLVALRPPAYDSPGTLGLHDTATGAVLTVDAFGTYLPAGIDDLGALGDDELAAGLVAFNRLNHPWTALADPARFGAAVDAVADLDPTLLLSSHGLAPAGRTDVLLDAMRTLPGMAPYVAPDDATFRQVRDELGG